MTRRFLMTAGMGIAVAVIGVLASASSAFAAATIGSLKLTGPNTLTIVYSQPVYTSPSDYTNFSGSFLGESVTSVSGSGTNTITLTLSGSVSSNATGYVTVGTNVQDVSDGQYFPGATWNILDAIGPEITYFSMSSNSSNGSFAGTNDTITVTFNANESVNIMNVTIGGHPVTPSGSGTGPFTASYTMQSSDNAQSVPVTITIADNYNNQTTAAFTYGGNVATGVPASASGLVISSITSNANTPGVLTNGDSITFTLKPLNPEPNARVTGSYNGVPLSWTTTNGGVNYVATYVVTAGQSSQPVALQISGVTITDQNGNVSPVAAGYDIQKTLNVTGAAAVSSSGSSVATTVTVTAPATSTAAETEIQQLESQLAALTTQQTSASKTNSASSYDFTVFLTVGTQDADVTALQERLTADGLYAGPISGYYGTLTEAAVEKYQAAHGIDAKGYVGPSTRAALNAGE